MQWNGRIKSKDKRGNENCWEIGALPEVGDEVTGSTLVAMIWGEIGSRPKIQDKQQSQSSNENDKSELYVDEKGNFIP